MGVKRWFTFPDPVNEVAARAVAAGVVMLATTILITRQWVLLWPLAYGFVARVAAGPRFSPLGRIAVHLVAPRFTARPVPGPPKRFAQGMGAVVTTSALILHYGPGSDTVVLGLLGAMVVFASLEAGFGFCVGCRIFALIQRFGWVAKLCESCELPRPARAK
ncbi:MAG: DUF4395 domain-containing protein [Acidimicrobiales bacterium]